MGAVGGAAASAAASGSGSGGAVARADDDDEDDEDEDDDEDYVDELPKVLKAEQRTKRMSVSAEPMDEKVRAPRRARARPAASERARP